MPYNVTENGKLPELESDDEFPIKYNEDSFQPMYLIDGRFGKINFSWKDNVKPCNDEILCDTETNSIHTDTDTNSIYTDKETTSTHSSNSEISHQKVAKNIFLKPMIYKGILKKHDLFCLKSIEGFVHDSILLWLINFLVHKDLQSEYNFLRSCLVSNTICNERMDIKYKSP